GQWSSAVEQYEKALATEKTDRDLWLKNARAYAALRKWDKVVDNCGGGLKPDFKDWITYSLLAQRAYAYGELGEKWNEAAVDLNDAVEISPYDVFMWYRLALVHLKRNSGEEYARTCTRMRERQYFRPNDLVWTCVLARGSVTDTAVLVQIAERAVA